MRGNRDFFNNEDRDDGEKQQLTRLIDIAT